jgi:exosortase/archaeosortase family protein
MERFVKFYFIFLGLLFAVFYAPTTPLSEIVNETQTHLTLFILNQYLAQGQLDGTNIWINSHYKIMITQACNGMIPILFLYASILAFPSSWRHKILWMMIGYILFFVINIIRILMVVYVTQAGRGHIDFHWSHDIIGNILLLVTGLGIFILFIKTSKISLKDF